MADLVRSWQRQGMAESSTAGYHRPDDFVLATASGRPTMRRQAHRTLQRVARRAGVIGKSESFRRHDLRAEFAVAALLAGDPVNAVQRMLGHKTSQMTLGLYGKLKGQEAVGTDAFARPEAEVVGLKAVGA